MLFTSQNTRLTDVFFCDRYAATAPNPLLTTALRAMTQWQCAACTYVNINPRSKNCSVCSTARHPLGIANDSGEVRAPPVIIDLTELCSPRGEFAADNSSQRRPESKSVGWSISDDRIRTFDAYTSSGGEQFRSKNEGQLRQEIKRGDIMESHRSRRRRLANSQKAQGDDGLGESESKRNAERETSEKSSNRAVDHLLPPKDDFEDNNQVSADDILSLDNKNHSSTASLGYSSKKSKSLQSGTWDNKSDTAQPKGKDSQTKGKYKAKSHGAIRGLSENEKMSALKGVKKSSSMQGVSYNSETQHMLEIPVQQEEDENDIEEPLSRRNVLFCFINDDQKRFGATQAESDQRKGSKLVKRKGEVQMKSINEDNKKRSFVSVVDDGISNISMRNQPKKNSIHYSKTEERSQSLLKETATSQIKDNSCGDFYDYKNGNKVKSGNSSEARYSDVVETPTATKRSKAIEQKLILNARKSFDGSQGPSKCSRLTDYYTQQKLPLASFEMLMDRANSILKKIFNHDSLRPLQEVAVKAALQQKSQIIIMATGGGKSLCYQLPALVNGAYGTEAHTEDSYVTIVVCPLIALMVDQVNNLYKRGVRSAACLSSSHSAKMKAEILQRLKLDKNVTQQGRAKNNTQSDSKSTPIHLLYCTPELIETERFRAILTKLHESQRLYMFAIDEAHCLSTWGHDFRPAYRKLTWVREAFPDIPVMACKVIIASCFMNLPLFCTKWESDVLFLHLKVPGLQPRR